MIQFFSNVWAWIVAHSDVIAGVLTPANLALLVTTIVSIIKAKKTVTLNTSVTSDVGNALKDAKVLQTVKQNSDEITDMKAQLADIGDGISQCVTKLNAVLQVQESAYSASNLPKDTRVAINNFIAAGKFAESKAHAAVADEITALKVQIQKLAEAGEKSAERIQKLTNTKKKTDANDTKIEGVRYD